MAGTLPPQQRAEFKALCDQLEALAPDDARRAQIEARLLQLLGTELPPNERRQHLRVQCELSVSVNLSSSTHPGVVVDLGSGGAFVVTPAPAKVGDVIELEAVAKTGEAMPSLTVKGRVAWVKDTRSAGRAGMGITFNADFLPNVRSFVLELLRSRLRA